MDPVAEPVVLFEDVARGVGSELQQPHAIAEREERLHLARGVADDLNGRPLEVLLVGLGERKLRGLRWTHPAPGRS